VEEMAAAASSLGSQARDLVAAVGVFKLAGAQETTRAKPVLQPVATHPNQRPAPRESIFGPRAVAQLEMAVRA